MFWKGNRKQVLEDEEQCDGESASLALRERYWLMVWGRGCGRARSLRDHPYIFMRWKELFFVNCSDEGSLTIAGFYYICLGRKTGRVNGFYFDCNSQQPQELDLQTEGFPYFSHGQYHFS